jgi:hypothetical protein
VDANDWRGALDVAKNQGQSGFWTALLALIVGMHTFKGQQPEARPARWETYISDLFQFHQLG